MTATATNTTPNGLPTRIQEMIQHIELDYPEWKSVPFQFGQTKMTMTRATRSYNAFPSLPLVIIKIMVEGNGKSIEFHVGMVKKKDGVYKEMYATYDADKRVQHTSRESVINEEVKADFDAFDEMLGHFLANTDKSAIVGAVSFQKPTEKKKQKEKEREEELEDAEGDSINSDDELGEAASDDSEDADVDEESVEEEETAEVTESSDVSSSEESSDSSSESEDERRYRKKSKKSKKHRHSKKNKKSDKLKKELKKMRRDLDDLMEENRRLRKKVKK